MIYQPYKWGGGYSKSEVDTLLNGKADTSHTHTKSQITDFPSYGTTANTICEGNDSRLSDARTPTSHTHTKSEITDFPSLATVATSGSYNDLTNKPTIPTVNDATLKIQKNGTDVKTFTANASSDVTCNITVPTKTSDLTNDSGFLTSHQSLSNYSTLANTIKSLSISGKTITYTKGDNTTGTLTTQDNNTWTAMVGATSSSNGSVGYVNAVPPKDGYNTKYLRADGTWQVPPDHTYTVNNATLTIQKNGTTVKTFTANASSNVTCNISVPTKTSELTNDSGFLTSHQSLSGYVPRNGGTVLNGRTFSRTVDNDFLAINGSSTDVNGAFLRLHGKDYSDTPYAGTIFICAQDGTNASNLLLKPDGTANWAGKNLAMKEDVIPRSGGSVLTGLSLSKINDNSFFELNGGSGWHHGAGISLRGKDCSAYGDAGCFLIQASDGTNDKLFVGSPNGTLRWGSKNVAMAEDVVPRSGGAVMTGTELGRTDNTSRFAICSGTDSNSGGNILLYPNAFGDADNAYRGAIGLYALTSYYVYKAMFLYPNGTWTWTGQAVQVTSDKRLKQQISKIDNALLDAWQDVEPCQFKYNDAVEQKGNQARLHTGYVVQQIDEACQKHNIDISAYGLYCHEEYPERTEEVTIENEDGTTSKETKVIEPAKEYYSLRYTETLVVECAYLRRENARLKERLQRHEDYFSNIEKRLQSLENS